jgi:hypothetical protein
LRSACIQLGFANYLAFIKLASIRIWLRVYESTPLGTILLGLSFPQNRGGISYANS